MEEEINSNLDSEELEEVEDELELSGGGGDSQGTDEEMQFDITIAATHSYMGPSLSAVPGRSVLEPGWVGRMPALPHRSCVFPGETVPMLFTDSRDATLLADTIAGDKLFGLLFPDDNEELLSGYGVVCEVFEARVEEGGAVQCKARAVHRLRLAGAERGVRPRVRPRVRLYGVRVLADVPPAHPLRLARLACLDSRRTDRSIDAEVSRLDAALTPWPQFLYDMFDYRRLRTTILDYFTTLNLAHMLPEDPVSLSFWVASNLVASHRDRLAMFSVDSAVHRLHMACMLVAVLAPRQHAWLCCVLCGAEIARKDHVFAMSSDGVHANYTNLGGYVHDVVTVTQARNLSGAGAASLEYSWYPGYAWRACECATCGAHLGWRFTAARRLRPAAFYALCRAAVVPPRPAPPPTLGHL